MQLPKLTPSRCVESPLLAYLLIETSGYYEFSAETQRISNIDVVQDRAELSTDVNTNTEGQSPPPLPPDDPPPLPPSEDPWSSNLKAERSARAYSRWDDSGAAQSSSQDAKPFQVLQSAGGV